MLMTNSVEKKFANVKVLNNISLRILSNDRIALLGQNGSGKTTLIRCMLGLYNFSGKIEFEGSNIRENRASFMKQLAFVPQISPPLDQTLGELVEMNLVHCKSSKEDIFRLARNLGLNIEDHQTKIFHRLSGGMKQKFLLSLAISRRPRLLILDEPTASLDSHARSAFYELLQTEVKESALIITSHRVDELLGIINRMLELDLGKVLLDQRINDHHVSDSSYFRNCTINVLVENEAFLNWIRIWNFTFEHDTQSWRGKVNSIDTHLFLSQLSRWAHLLGTFNLGDNP